MSDHYHRWSHKTLHEIFNEVRKTNFGEDCEDSNGESEAIKVDKLLKADVPLKPWYRKTSFREAAQTIKYVSTGSYFQRNTTKLETNVKDLYCTLSFFVKEFLSAMQIGCGYLVYLV